MITDGRSRLVAACVAGIIAAFAQSAASQSDSSAPISVKGSERIAWDQTAPPGGWIVAYRFVAFVDDRAQALADASCTPVFCTQCMCSAPLPLMSGGAHRVELTARDVFGRESSRSAPIYLILGSGVPLTSTVAGVAPPAGPASTRASPDGSTPGIEILAASLDRPSAIAVAPDGRVFVAQHSGVIVVWQDGRVQSRPAATLDDMTEREDVGLVGLTLHPAFSTNSQLFVAYAAQGPDGRYTNRVVRYREVAGVFGEAAVIFEDRVDEPPLRKPRIRFGPDGKIYVLFPAGANGDVSRGASYTGKILRLNEDGSTPKDNPGLTPVFVDTTEALVAFDWHPGTLALWVTGSSGGRSFLATAVAARLGRSPSYRFWAGLDPAAMAFYSGDRIAGLADQLLIASIDGARIRRIRFNPADLGREIVMPSWPHDPQGVISDIVVGPDGAVYYSAFDRQWRTADQLVRITTGPR